MSKTEQPPAGDFTKRFRILLAAQDKTAVVQDGYEACDRLDRSEASREELLTACNMGLNAMRGLKDINQLHDGSVENERRLEAHIEQIKAVIAKEKEVKK